MFTPMWQWQTHPSLCDLGLDFNLYDVMIVPQSGVKFHPHENGELKCFPFLCYCSFYRFYDIANKVFAHTVTKILTIVNVINFSLISLLIKMIKYTHM